MPTLTPTETARFVTLAQEFRDLCRETGASIGLTYDGHAVSLRFYDASLGSWGGASPDVTAYPRVIPTQHLTGQDVDMHAAGEFVTIVVHSASVVDVGMVAK